MTHKKRILLIEDEKTIGSVLKMNLELENYFVQYEYSSKNGLLQAEKHPWDLIVLDILLPDKTGLELAEQLKIKNITCKILFISAHQDHKNTIRGLQLGDDFLRKPFELDEFILRVGNLTRITEKNSLSNYVFVGNTLYFDRFEFENYKGEKGTLSKKETALLKLFIYKKNTLVSRKEILEKVWEYETLPDTRTIDNYLLFFRKTFEIDPKNPTFFVSVRGEGYIFKQ